MNNQNRILKHRQIDDIGDDEVSFHENEEEHNYLGKKELVEIEGDKSIDPDFSYDDDKSKASTIKRNTNTELMKLLSDSTTEVYNKKLGTNNLNGSTENDFSKELSRDSELNNIINSKNFNAPLMRPGNDNFISSINQFDNQNPNLKYSNIIQQIPTKIDNNFYYGNSNFNTDYDNILNNKNNTFINNNSKKFKNNNFNTFNKFNNNNKIYQINSFDYFIQGKNLNNFKQSNPSFGILQNIELEKNYKELEKNYNELEKSYNEVLNLIEYWQNFYLDIAKLVLENININKNDPFSNEFKFAVIENVKSIVKLAKDKAFSIFKICNEESFNLLNHKMSLKNKKNDFTLYNNLNIEIIGKEKNNILMFSKENDFMIKILKLNNQNNDDYLIKKNKSFKRKKYYKDDDSLDSLPPVIYRKYKTEGTNTDSDLFDEIKPMFREIINEEIIEKENKIFKKEKLKISNQNSFKIKQINKQIIKTLNKPKTPKNQFKLKIVSIPENKINIIQNKKEKEENIKIFKIQNCQTEINYLDLDKLELLNRKLSLQISEVDKENKELKQNLKEKIKLLSEIEKEKNQINTETNTINSNNSTSQLNSSFLFLPEMIPPEKTYKIFIHCVKHFKYEEENYKKYMEEEDLQNLKYFVNKMEKYLIGTSYPVQRKIHESIHYYKPIESSAQKKYKESILTGIKPLTLIKSRTNSKNKNIDYRSYSTVNNNSTFNKFKAVIKALKNN